MSGVSAATVHELRGQPVSPPPTGRGRAGGEEGWSPHVFHLERLHGELAAVGLDGRGGCRHVFHRDRALERRDPGPRHGCAALLQRAVDPSRARVDAPEVRRPPRLERPAEHLFVEPLGALVISSAWIAKWATSLGIVDSSAMMSIRVLRER